MRGSDEHQEERQRHRRGLINLIVDPHEREPITLPHLHSWTATHFNRIMRDFHESVQHEPLTPAGAPLDHVPTPP